MKKALIINAHQFFEGISAGKLNQTMAGVIHEELVRQHFEVVFTNIEQGYDIDAEVRKHLEADLIVLQSPVFWFGMPWIYKKYVDEVFTAGMFQQTFLDGDGRTRKDPKKQYGTGGKCRVSNICCHSPGMLQKKLLTIKNRFYLKVKLLTMSS